MLIAFSANNRRIWLSCATICLCIVSTFITTRSNPKSVSVDDKTRESWNINITNYILPIWDFEAYENQPVEKDANTFAENVMVNGLVNSNHLNESYYG